MFLDLLVWIPNLSSIFLDNQCPHVNLHMWRHGYEKNICLGFFTYLVSKLNFKEIYLRKVVKKVHSDSKSVWLRRNQATSLGWWVIEMFLAFSGDCSIPGESLPSTPDSMWASVKSHTCPWTSGLEDIRATLKETKQHYS